MRVLLCPKGAAFYVGARAMGAPLAFRIWLGFSTAVLARWLAWENDIRLPKWASPHNPPKAQEKENVTAQE